VKQTECKLENGTVSYNFTSKNILGLTVQAQGFSRATI